MYKFIAIGVSLALAGCVTLVPHHHVNPFAVHPPPAEFKAEYDDLLCLSDSGAGIVGFKYGRLEYDVDNQLRDIPDSCSVFSIRCNERGKVEATKETHPIVTCGGLHIE